MRGLNYCQDYFIQEFGIFNQNNPQQFDEISEKIIQKRELNALEIFKIFLHEYL